MRRAFSVSVFARHAGRVLLVRHERLATWLPVGGEIEAGETPLEAAVRELREETGLSGEFPATGGVDGAPPGLLAYEEHPAASKGTHLNFCFVADVPTDAVVACDEYGEHRWVRDTAGLACPRNVEELVRMAIFGGDALEALARAWLDAFNARDLDRLLGLYAEDARHYSPKLKARQPETEGWVRGQAALRAWWDDSFRRLPGLRYEERAVTAGRDRVVLEYERTVPGEAPMRVAETYAVRDGRITESRVFHG